VQKKLYDAIRQEQLRQRTREEIESTVRALLDKYDKKPVQRRKSPPRKKSPPRRKSTKKVSRAASKKKRK